MSDYGDIFSQKNSAESIFELQYTLNHGNSNAFWFFPQELGGRWGFSPTAELYGLYGPTDERRDASIGVTANKGYVRKFFRMLNITADRLLFPVPQAERDVNSKLSQNPGY